MTELVVDRRALLQRIITGVLFAVAAIAALLFLITPAREFVVGLISGKSVDPPTKPWSTPVKVIRDANGGYGLTISDDAMANLQVDPVELHAATKPQPMPPQIGTVNFDNDFLYTIRPRFGGEVVSFYQVKINRYPELPLERDLSFTDRIKQGEVLAVYSSKDLGMAKAGLVDAIVNKKLSEEVLKRHEGLYEKGAISLATLEQSRKQLRTDINAWQSALRPLIIWKLSKDEINDVEKEATTILKTLEAQEPESDDKRWARVEAEAKRWARVEIKAPVFALDEKGDPDPTRDLVVLEKNFNVGEFVDPGRDLPLFRLADLSRLQVWVHPPEEYLPLLRTYLSKNGPGSLKWQVRFQADGLAVGPLELSVSKIGPSLDPTLKTPMLIGELKNPDRKYLVGQFVTATIYLPPPQDEKGVATTVEVPTDAINLVESQSLVWVRKKDGNKNDYYLRRVAIAQTAGKWTLVRSVLTDDDLKLSAAEQAKGRRPIEPLMPGEIVLTRGVVELTAALDDQINNPKKD